MGTKICSSLSTSAKKSMRSIIIISYHRSRIIARPFSDNPYESFWDVQRVETRYLSCIEHVVVTRSCVLFIFFHFRLSFRIFAKIVKYNILSFFFPRRNPFVTFFFRYWAKRECSWFYALMFIYFYFLCTTFWLQRVHYTRTWFPVINFAGLVL